MIQRKQSLYLVLIIAISAILVFSHFLKFADSAGRIIILNIRGIFLIMADSAVTPVERLIPFTIVLTGIFLISGVTIFLYRNRKRQMKFAFGLIILQIMFIASLLYFAFRLITQNHASFLPDVNSILPLIMLLLSFLAWRAIRKDEEMVRSYDRLR